MAFNSLEYAIFLVVVFLAFWALSRFGLARIAFLTIVSFVFYAASNPMFLLPLVASTFVDYFVAMGLAPHNGVLTDEEKTRKSSKRRTLLIVSIVSNLGLLGYFKYTNFLYEAAVGVGNLFGADLVFTRLDILLPAGISFYTFQTLSYTIDVYRGTLPVERNFLRFAFFVGFFPQLVAGPIVRAADFLPQIHKPPFFTRQQASRALWLIGIGILKKIAVADILGVDIVEKVWADPSRVSSWDVLIGLYAYTMQIYMDFSAYSDIAIGSAMLFGYHLPDNFDRPYAAVSIQDFWRRWHKTLGSWLRDYLYYPLGGARGSDLRVYFNLFVTFVIIGFWHGANINFLLYGVGHALAMCANRWWRKRRERAGKSDEVLGAWGLVWRVALTLQFVVFMRILFRSADPHYTSAEALAKAGDITGRLFDGAFSDVTVLTPWLAVLLIGSYVVHWTPRYWVESTWHGFRRLPFVLQGAVVAAAIMLAAKLISGRPLPFEYFQF
jgi:D-alanyl-lipoteichoic acid acyltransferase DltB (MBOAT superfamily)